MGLGIDSIARRLSLPATCEVCGSWPVSDALCNDCVRQFAQPRERCLRCGLALPAPLKPCPDCAVRPPLLGHCVVSVDYAYPWDRLVQALKFSDRPELARPLAELMRHSPWAEPTLEAAHWVTAVPLSPPRLRLRGYNQSHELARRLAPTKCRSDLLLRLDDTPSQVGLNAAQRERNVAHAFAPRPGGAHLLRDRSVLLIDDVMTSGATIRAAARALHSAGAARVDALVLARTDPFHHVQHRPGSP